VSASALAREDVFKWLRRRDSNVRLRGTNTAWPDCSNTLCIRRQWGNQQGAGVNSFIAAMLENEERSKTVPTMAAAVGGVLAVVIGLAATALL
jgi:hypothetical protein